MTSAQDAGAASGVSTRVERLRSRWDEHGRTDPMWAVLTDPDKSGGRWRPDDFYAHGRVEIERLIERLDELGVADQRKRALDFGCGVGRLTNALADHYEHVDGVDISAEMVKRAAELAPHRDRCTFQTNVAEDLRIFADDQFDLVHSNIVLQHVGPVLTRAYIAEFARIVKPGGAVHFQLPVNPAPGAIGFALQVVPQALLNRLRGMSMHGISETRVQALLYSRGLRVVATDPDESAGRRWLSRRYTAVKPIEPAGK
ncbi:MAG: class I SAM-dependent methyltransferase [Actinomycetota bacterium]|nr:class I SAM-dependent methyltransferase [Actinomycetota bacterium]